MQNEPGLLGPGSFARTLDRVGHALHDVELFRVRMPFIEPFRTARATTAAKEALLVRVRTDHGVGWGECAAQVTPEYDGETIDGARLALRDHLVPRVFAGVGIEDVRGHASARAALECALLDARLRAEETSLAKWLGAPSPEVEAGVAVGIGDDVGALARAAGDYAARGYRRIKCKIEPGRDVEVLQAVRAEVGDAVQVAADANGSYELAAARRLFDEIADLKLQCVEQPCAPGALPEHAQLVQQGRTRVCLDESITSLPTARAAIAARACNAISVKVGRLGIADATRVHDVCLDAGIDAVAGGLLETGVGRAALVAVAALPGFTLTGDCAASDRYFGADGDVTEPFVLRGGMLQVPEGAGLGVSPAADRLARVTVARERLTARD